MHIRGVFSLPDHHAWKTQADQGDTSRNEAKGTFEGGATDFEMLETVREQSR